MNSTASTMHNEFLKIQLVDELHSNMTVDKTGNSRNKISPNDGFVPPHLLIFRFHFSTHVIKGLALDFSFNNIPNDWLVSIIC